MSAIGPGDFVECVDASRKPHNTHQPKVVEGRVYRVVEVGLAAAGGRWLPGLLLADAPPARPNGFYRADRFRPIYRPKSSLIEQLKRPVSEPA